MPAEIKPHRTSSNAVAHLDRLLDQALEQTFPASDAVAIQFERDREQEVRVLHSYSLLANYRKAR